MKYLKVAWNAWNSFWFTPVHLYPISLFRLIFGLSAFAFYLPRQFNLQELFYDDGMMPLELAKQVYGGKYHAFFFNFPVDPQWIQGMHALFLVSLFFLALGFGSRLWALVAFVLHVLFLQRNFTVLWGADKVTSFWLLYLVLAESDRFFSLRSLIRKKPVQNLSDDILTPAICRLFQIQLCIIYAYSGLEKLKGPTWWYGSALWNIISNGKMMPFDASFMSHFPMVLVIGCYSTLIFEIYFPLAVWLPRLRLPWLCFGILMHGMIAIIMDLPSFSIFMVSAYLFFVNPVVLREKIRSFDLFGQQHRRHV